MVRPSSRSHSIQKGESKMRALVTGAASGIGRAVCRRLAADAARTGETARIAAVDITPSAALDDLVSELSGRVWGATVRPLTADDADALYGTPGENTLGGDWFVDGGAPQAPGLTLVWQLDSTGAVLRDPDWNRVPLLADDAWDGSRVSDGLYQGVSLSDWASVSELLEP